MRTHATSHIGEMGLKNFQKTKESLRNIEIFLLLKPKFLHTKFDFLQRLSAFFNGFLIFFNGFPLSSTDFQFSSTAFCFPRNPRNSIYGEKYTKDHYLSFVFFSTCSPTHGPSFVIPATIPCLYIAINTLSTLGSLFPSIPPYLVVRDSGT
jgi:hypothetical protein